MFNSSRIASVAGLALVLGACQMPRQTAAPIVVAALPPPRVLTRADVTVANATVQLTRYCDATKLALSAVGFFADGKVELAANYARVAVVTVCDNPPSDVRTALVTINRAFAALIEVNGR